MGGKIMKIKFETLIGQVGVWIVCGNALMAIGGIAGIVMTIMNIIFGYMSGLTTVCGTILIFCAIVGILFYAIGDGVAEYTIRNYPDESEKL